VALEIDGTEASMFKKLILIIAALLVIVMMAGSVLYWYRSNISPPADTTHRQHGQFN
jgi:hypothetical protein